MPKVVGIICEYNPFHKGHAYQIDEVRRREEGATVVALMSGAFTQRGSAALFPKYDRAKAAVACGADLVLELPFPYSAGGAEFFARAGVRILAALGGVDTLAFGCETESGEDLARAASLLSDLAFREELAARSRDRAEMARGFAPLRARMMREKCPDLAPDLLEKPNNILAVEYLRAIAEEGAPMRPMAIRRIGDYHDTNTTVPLASASAIRDCIARDGFDAAEALLPEAARPVFRDCIERGAYVLPEHAERVLLTFLRLSSPERLSAFAEMTDDLAHRLKAAAEEAASLEDFYRRAAAKRYTNAKIRRAILFALLEITPQDLAAPPAFTQLLAANARGCAFLSEIRKTSAIPVITKPADYEAVGEAAAGQYVCLLRAESLYGALCHTVTPGTDALRRGPILEKV